MYSIPKLIVVKNLIDSKRCNAAGLKEQIAENSVMSSAGRHLYPVLLPWPCAWALGWKFPICFTRLDLIAPGSWPPYYILYSNFTLPSLRPFLTWWLCFPLGEQGSTINLYFYLPTPTLRTAAASSVQNCKRIITSNNGESYEINTINKIESLFIRPPVIGFRAHINQI